MTTKTNFLSAFMMLSIVSIGLVGINQAFAQTTNLQGQINVVSICAVSVTNGSFDFGSLGQSEISGEILVNVDNTGTASAGIETSGANWKDAGAVDQMNVGQTHVTGGFQPAYASKDPLTNTPASFGAVTPATNQDLTYQVQIDLLTTTFTGAITQSIDVIITCT